MRDTLGKDQGPRPARGQRRQIPPSPCRRELGALDARVELHQDLALGDLSARVEVDTRNDSWRVVADGYSFRCRDAADGRQRSAPNLGLRNGATYDLRGRPHLLHLLAHLEERGDLRELHRGQAPDESDEEADRDEVTHAIGMLRTGKSLQVCASARC